MPCRTGYEDIPKFEPTEEWLKRQEEIKISKENLKEYTELEKEAFASYMSVFLCRAMVLLESNGLLQHTYHDMEWWWKEHCYRDDNKNASSLSKKEIEEKLVQIKNKYKVQ